MSVFGFGFMEWGVLIGGVGFWVGDFLDDF